MNEHVPILRSHFQKDAMDVHLDRPCRQAQFASDSFVCQAASDQERDLTFARA
jgi:hypothetical protein